MATDEWAALDGVAQGALVRSAEVSPLELVDAAIARIEAIDPEINAVIHRSFERARDRARSDDPALREGVFAGVPFLMKDLGGEEAGEPQHAGLMAAKKMGWTEAEDSSFAHRVRGAGFVNLGRTNTPELALLPTSEPEAYGPTRNPWSLAHSAGGSSGGAAAVVAAGIVPVAHASDGGGSIRGPASKCGLVGLKPTRGRISFGPQGGERWSGFSTNGVVTRSVRDAAHALEALASVQPGDPYSAPLESGSLSRALEERPRELRIGLFPDAPRDLELHDEARVAVENAGKLLESLGHRVEIAHPEALEDPQVVASYVAVISSNVAAALDAWSAKLGKSLGQSDVEPLTWALAERGRGITAPELLAQLNFTHALGRRIAAWYDDPGFDLLVTPTMAVPPAEIGFLSSTAEEPFRAFVRAGPFGVFTLPFNLTGQPALSLPLHWTAGEPSLPLGVQFVAPTGCEARLISLAAQLEEAAPWADRWPPTSAPRR